MTDFRKWALVGLLGFGLVSVGCSSSNDNGGTGGATGSGGTNAGSGGSSSTGGSSGEAGAGGAAPGCQMSDAPASADIATFASADGGISPMFGTFRYGDTPEPTFTVDGGMVKVTDTVQIGATSHYQGFGIYFNGNADGTDCVDATTYTGVQFDISGSLMGTGCTMQFSINDSEHAVVSADDPKAGAPMGSYAPQVQITQAQLTSTATTIQVPFTGTGSPAFSNGGASPATPVDPMKLTGVQWQMSTPVAAATGDAGAAECNWNINISNVKFY